jgi:hypothetical protein
MWWLVYSYPTYTCKTVLFSNHWIRRKNVFKVYINHLDPVFQVIELQHQKYMLFTINIILDLSIKLILYILLFTQIYQQYNLYKYIL